MAEVARHEQRVEKASLARATPDFGGLFGLPVFIGGDAGVMNLVYVLIAIVSGMVCTFVATTILYKDEA